MTNLQRSLRMSLPPKQRKMPKGTRESLQTLKKNHQQNRCIDFFLTGVFFKNPRKWFFFQGAYFSVRFRAQSGENLIISEAFSERSCDGAFSCGKVWLRDVHLRQANSVWTILAYRTWVIERSANGFHVKALEIVFSKYLDAFNNTKSNKTKKIQI